MPNATPFLDRSAEGKFESQFFRNSECWGFPTVSLGGKMKSILICVFLLLFSSHPALSCDKKELICVASTVFEKGVVFRHPELKEFYCEESIPIWEFSVKATEIAIEKFKEQGIDYYKQEFHDFSELRYDPIEIKKGIYFVKITGNTVFGFKGTNFKTKKETNSSVILMKDQESGEFCYLTAKLPKQKK
jgi:hypothetical protein